MNAERRWGFEENSARLRQLLREGRITNNKGERNKSMALYDIVLPKEGQLTLTCNGAIIANAKNKTYLVNKMRVHQDECCDVGIQCENVYQIVDMHKGNFVLETFKFPIGQRGNGQKRAPQGKNINFVIIDSIVPVQYSSCYAIADEKGNIITDLDLLKRLYDFRFENRIPCEITNKTLAYFATYLPVTKADFISSYGVGERVYDKCGEKFLDVIRAYIESKK